MIKNTKQQWTIGAVVKIGFVSDLIVVAHIHTSYDTAANTYILNKADKWYSFVPHNGLTKITPEEAKQAVLTSKKIQAKIEEQNKIKLQSIEKAAQLRSELMA